MPKRAGITTKEHLLSAPLPEQTKSYTVISHGFIIDKAKEVLDRMGFDIVRELYRCNEDANIAQGVYHLKFEGDQDPEMGMMFAWANSYDKSMRFKCAVGGYLNTSQSVIISGQMGSWNRKHSGTADTEASDTIISQIENAKEYYSQLVEDKKNMKTITISEKQRAELTGRMYLQYELLTGEQLGIARNEFKKPSFDYNAPADSLWTMYNGLVFALQKAHPKTWMDQQRMIHWYLTEEFGIKSGYVADAPIVVLKEDEKEVEIIDPAQLSLIEEIKVNETEDTATLHPEGTVSFEVDEAKVVSIAPLQGETLISDDVNIVLDNKPPMTEAPVTSFALEATLTETSVAEKENPTLEDNSWPCLDCGKTQPETAVFNEGQLCTECFNKH